MPSQSPLLDFSHLFPLWTPDVPDLGCFVERRHDLESYNFYVWGEPAPWTTSGIITHQTYARVLCGEAAFHQRARAVMLHGASSMFDAITATPHFVLGGDFRPRPSEWIKFAVQADERIYWFVGEHRDPSRTTWERDAIVGHSLDIYEHGTLSTVHFDDTGGDRDLDDSILEVAVVRRSRFFDVLDPVAFAEAEVRRFEQEQFPRIREAVRDDRRVTDDRATAG